MPEPISATIAAALATGAAAALKETASAVVKDGYNAVKAYISSKFHRVNAEEIERNPASTARQAVLSEELESAGADKDQRLRELVAELIRRVEEHAPDAAPVGVNLGTLKAKLLEIGEVSEGTGVRANAAEVETLRINQIGKKKS
jgi:hypothetical protein